MEYYSATKRSEIVPFEETVIQSEVSQKEKNKYCIISLYGESRKMIQMNSFAKQK